MMKKISTMFLMVSLLAFAAYAGQATSTVSWEQVISPDFAGWKLYRSETSGGSYTEVLDIPYVLGMLSPYEVEYTMTSPDGEERTYFFVMKAYDNNGNHSVEYSNEASLVVDFEGPATPFSFSIRWDKG